MHIDIYICVCVCVCVCVEDLISNTHREVKKYHPGPWLGDEINH